MRERFDVGVAWIPVMLGLGLVLLSRFVPGYLTDPKALLALIFLQVLVVCVWHYERFYLPFLAIAFFWAAMDLPMSGPWTVGRWVVLGVGAFVGLIRSLRVNLPWNRGFYLVSFLCVVSALVSAMVSAIPTFALMKVASLFLLFLYAASGARLALAADPGRLFRGLLLGCEIGVYGSAIAYFVFDVHLWGNSNALGAVQGVVAAPFLLWGALVAETGRLRLRRWIAFLGALYLVYFSVTRAGLLASAVSICVLLVGLRRQKLIAWGVLGLVTVLALTALISPEHFRNTQESVSTGIIYKGHREAGLLGSRLSPWQETLQVIQDSPYFGNGFGTSTSGDKQFGEVNRGTFRSTSETNREHGSSYLAITEWVGLVGIVPFALLIAFLVRAIVRVFRWMRNTRSAAHYSVPLMAFMVAGLVHAFFEDWLFAVGYYLTVLFWICAFLLMDLLPSPAPQYTATVYEPVARPIASAVVP